MAVNTNPSTGFMSKFGQKYAQPFTAQNKQEPFAANIPMGGNINSMQQGVQSGGLYGFQQPNTTAGINTGPTSGMPIGMIRPQVQDRFGNAPSMSGQNPLMSMKTASGMSPQMPNVQSSMDSSQQGQGYGFWQRFMDMMKSGNLARTM